MSRSVMLWAAVWTRGNKCSIQTGTVRRRLEHTIRAAARGRPGFFQGQRNAHKVLPLDELVRIMAKNGLEVVPLYTRPITENGTEITLAVLEGAETLTPPLGRCTHGIT